MRVLIVSYESWRETNNGGNVLSNIFESFSDAEFAQVYCSGELPHNKVCQKYYQISDSMLLTKSKGRKLLEKEYGSEDETASQPVYMNSKIPKCFYYALLLARELLWGMTNWKTDGLVEFIQEFSPDIIFAPCYSYYHVSKLALYIKSIAKCPMVSYISDDNYSLRQLIFAPSFWVNRLITRKWIRKLFSECTLIYTMTELQKKEYEGIFHKPMKVLCKSADFAEREKNTEYPIQFIYAGGLYLNRWKILAKLAKEIEKVNKNQVKAQLHIFSNSTMKERQRRFLNDGKNVFLHSSISYDKLMAYYRKSDVAVFVESFDLKNRLITRLSFSTKIIDCLNSTCAILAIGPTTQAGITYLKNHDAAICADRIQEITSKVRLIVENKDIITVYAQKAYRLGMKNHSKTDIIKGIQSDFHNILSNIH